MIPRYRIPKPKYIITKEYGGYTLKKLVRKTSYIRFLFFFKKKYEYFGHCYVLKENSTISALWNLKDNVLIFDSKKQAKKYIKNKAKKEYFVY